MSEVLEGLNVYPDNMLLELVESRGCYASDEAKEVLKELAEARIPEEECYRIVQLASFNVFEPSSGALAIRENPPTSYEQAGQLLLRAASDFGTPYVTIRELIARARLRVSPELEADETAVARWNKALDELFADDRNVDRWNGVFEPAHLLRHEPFLYKQLLGE